MGHPDKVCDRVSDSILDFLLSRQNDSRAGIECFATTNRIIVGGEFRTDIPPTNDEFEKIIRNSIKSIGYDQPGFHWNTLDVEILLHQQSKDIAMGVDKALSHPEGAGDQGIMFGYATNETDNLMPAPIFYAHKILKHLTKTWQDNPTLGVGPDAKSQITLRYENGCPTGCEAILVSMQHREHVSLETVREIVRESVLASIPKGWMCEENNFYVNPTGRFVIGGPNGDAGLTGRKIIVDTYGGAAPHGGGAFSGKDPTKTDRSGAYIARYIAKNIVASGIASRCLIQLSYAIGIAHPISLHINTHRTTTTEVEDKLYKIIPTLVDLSPSGIRQHLKLNQPIYTKTSSYGHFGQAPESNGAFSWEKLDLISAFKDL